MKTTFPLRKRQRGATLIVALVLLVSMALLGIWGFNSSTTNMRIVGNMQVRQEATEAVQAAIETTISTPLFTTSPTAVAAAAVPVSVNGVTYDVWLKDSNGQRQPACYRAKTIKQDELDVDVQSDVDCTQEGDRNTGIESDSSSAAATAGDSICSQSEWNVYAQVTDAQTGTFVAINQGVGTRVLSTDAETACPTTP